MRDVHGRYTNPKLISDNGPSWARGCPACTFGIAAAPELTSAAPLYLERIVQAVDGDITFCACQAGQAYRVSLLNRYQAIVEQDKREARILTHKVAGSEAALTPENTLRIDSPLAIARIAINAARARNTPTMHFDGVAVPPPADELEAEAVP